MTEEPTLRLTNPPTDQPDWGMRVAHFRDPDGNLAELYSELPSDDEDAA